MIEKGDWIEISDRIFEIQKVFENGYSVKEVLYKEPTLKLKYGPVTFIGKNDFYGEDGVYEWEKYLMPFVNISPGLIMVDPL